MIFLAINKLVDIWPPVDIQREPCFIFWYSDSTVVYENEHKQRLCATHAIFTLNHVFRLQCSKCGLEIWNYYVNQSHMTPNIFNMHTIICIMKEGVINDLGF